MTSLLSEFIRASRSWPCPVCGRKKYCLIDRDSPDAPGRVVCTQIETSRRWGEAGWLHVLRDEPWRRPHARTRGVEAAAEPQLDFVALAAALREEVDLLGFFSLRVGLGLSAGSLERLGLGWASKEALHQIGMTCAGGAWSFPMVDAAGRVIGIRLRTLSGYKFAVTRSRQGIFVPNGLRPAGQLLLAEGPTDAAALLDLGFDAAGRPSCSGGVKHCVGLVKRLKPREVVVVSDADEPGRKGAAALASTLRAYTQCVKIIRPPEGVKDARAWKATAHDQAVVAAQVTEAINAAVPVSARIAVRAGGR